MVERWLIGLVVSGQGLSGPFFPGCFGLARPERPSGQRARRGLGCYGGQGILIYCTIPATKHMKFNSHSQRSHPRASELSVLFIFGFVHCSLLFWFMSCLDPGLVISCVFHVSFTSPVFSFVVDLCLCLNPSVCFCPWHHRVSQTQCVCIK